MNATLPRSKAGTISGCAFTVAVFLVASCFAVSSSAVAQSTPAAAAQPAPDTSSVPTPGDNIRFGYEIHQSIDLGGHIVEHSGSGAVYDTMVNLHSGPRILAFSLDMRSVSPSHAKLFDRLTTNSFGYGGDPNSVTTLNFSKGRLYDFQSSFRRDRQYFDYDLLSNPLIPPTSSPDIPILDSPHLYNTVRRALNINLKLAPLSVVTGRLSYGHNVMQGPSNSTIHIGTEGLLTQMTRNSTDSLDGGIDWKPLRRTTFSFDEFITRYKGDTTWQLTGLNYHLSNGTPVALGVDISSVWATPCAAPFVAGNVSPTCNAYLSYNRLAPTRTLFPTEQFLFQSAAIPNFTMNGRFLYSATTSNLNNFDELFNGYESRGTVRQTLVTGSARARRINADGDFSATWQIVPKFALTDTFDFSDFRIPATNILTTATSTGASMLVAPNPPTTATTSTFQFLNQKTKTNTLLAAWDMTSRARASLGYRYRSRIITDAGGDFIPIHEHWALFASTVRPSPELRINLNIDAMYADKSFTRISPRQLQHYIVRTTYTPRPWLAFDGTMNIRESRDNVQTVNHLEHDRDFSLGTTISPNEHWSLDLNYSYNSVYSSTIECYASTPAPPTATAAPAVCVTAATPYMSTGYYNAPTQYGSVGFTWTPIKRLHTRGGYRISSVSGNSDLINIRQVNGSLQSSFQSPYAAVDFDLMPNWTWKADYTHYGYGEGSPVGPTLQRNFRGNVTTIAVQYAF